MQTSNFSYPRSTDQCGTVSPVDDIIRDAVGRATQKSRSAHERTVEAIGSLVRRVETNDGRQQQDLVDIANECSSSLTSLRTVLNVLSHKMTALESNLDDKRLQPIQAAYRALETRVEQIAAHKAENSAPEQLLSLLAKLDQNVVEIGQRLAEATANKPATDEHVAGLSDRLEQVTRSLEQQTTEFRSVKSHSDSFNPSFPVAEITDALEGNKAALGGIDQRVLQLTDLLARGFSEQENRRVSEVITILEATGLKPGAYTRQTEVLETIDRNVQNLSKVMQEHTGSKVADISQQLYSALEIANTKLDKTVDALGNVQTLDLLRGMDATLSSIKEGLNHGETDASEDTTSVPMTLRRDLGDLRVLQEAGDRRTLAALDKLQASLDLIASRLDPQQLTEARDANAEETKTSAARAAASRAMNETRRDTVDETRTKLIEPGMGRPSFLLGAPSVAVPEEPANEQPTLSGDHDQDATSAADKGQVTENLVSSARKSMRASADASSVVARAQSFPKKPFAIGLASLVMVMGAYNFIPWGAITPGLPVTAPVTATVAPSLAPLPKAFAPEPMASAVQSPSLPLPGNGVADIPLDMRDRFDPANVEMIFDVAVRLMDGVGTKRDPKLAQAWLERAAQQGSVKASYRLGSGYEKGAFGERDIPKAKVMYEAAAQKGNVTAMHNLAVLMTGGETADYVLASTWFTKAAEHGLRDSQYNVAVLAARGLGSAVDLRTAYKWFSIAAQNGDTAAVARKDEVARRLDQTTLAAALADVKAFQPKTPIASANEALKPAS